MNLGEGVASERVETMETWKLPCAARDLKNSRRKLDGNLGNLHDCN